MNVTSKISVDLTRPNIGSRVNAVQGDGNTRLVDITLLSGGQPWTPPEGVEAAIAYMQPGGTKGLYNKLADGTSAISISGNVATIILAPQMLTASGTVQASLVFNDAQLNRLTTFPFSVSVAPNPSAGAQKVEDYLRLQWLEDKLDEYLRKAADSGAFDGKPGDNGVTFTPSVSENGDLSWRNNGGLPNPQTVNIRGPQGDSTAATAAAHAAQTSAANAETHAAGAAASAAAAQEAVVAMGTELSQIKDDLSDKLPKSPVNWEPWTAEEQAAARDRIGIPGDFELIEEIVVEDDVSIVKRTIEPDGTPYNFKKMFVYIQFPEVLDARTFYSSTKQNLYFAVSVGANMAAFDYCDCSSGVPIGFFMQTNDNSSPAKLSGYPKRSLSSGNKIVLTGYKFGSASENYPIYTGTVIKIYGVRS